MKLSGLSGLSWLSGLSGLSLSGAIRVIRVIRVIRAIRFIHPDGLLGLFGLLYIYIYTATHTDDMFWFLIWTLIAPSSPYINPDNPEHTHWPESRHVAWFLIAIPHVLATLALASLRSTRHVHNTQYLRLLGLLGLYVHTYIHTVYIHIRMLTLHT